MIIRKEYLEQLRSWKDERNYEGIRVANALDWLLER